MIITIDAIERLRLSVTRSLNLAKIKNASPYVNGETFFVDPAYLLNAPLQLQDLSLFSFN